MTRRALTAALVAGLLVAGNGGATAGAQSRSSSAPPASAAAAPPAARQAEINDQIQTLRDQVSDASTEEADLLDRIDQVQSRKRRLDARLAEVDRQVDVVQAEATSAEASLERVQSEFVRAQTRLDLENEALAAEHQKLRDRAVAAYIANPSSNAAELMLKAGNMREIAATAGYLKTVVELQRDAVRRYTARRDATGELRASVGVQKDRAKLQRDVVVNRLSDLEALRAEQQSVRDQVAADEAEHTQLLDEVRQRRAEFQAQIDALKTESSGITSLLRSIQSGATPGRAPGSGVLASPISGAVITSTFGPRVHPVFGDVRMHEGVDLGASSGTPIRAAAAGTVVSADVRGGYGNATVIDHGGGLATLYGHQSQMLVTAGQTVTAGQVIGAVGSTGFSTGPHLHFEVRLSGVPVDPLLYLAH